MFDLQVLNIIAELKAENSVEIIELLKGHGFHCMKYREQYGGVLPSDVPFNISGDRRLMLQHPYAADVEYVHDHPYVADAVWGVGCDEAHGSALKDAEVCVFCRLHARNVTMVQDHWFVLADAMECFWGSGSCGGLQT